MDGETDGWTVPIANTHSAVPAGVSVQLSRVISCKNDVCVYVCYLEVQRFSRLEPDIHRQRLHIIRPAGRICSRHDGLVAVLGLLHAGHVVTVVVRRIVAERNSLADIRPDSLDLLGRRVPAAAPGGTVALVGVRVGVAVEAR